jgi:diguanylate cyclase
MAGDKHIGHRIVAMMDRLGVAPLTRNYHLFYVCLANSNPAVRRAVRNLGLQPAQHEIDQVIAEFCPDATESQVMKRHENAVLRTIDDLALRLELDQSEMCSFHEAVERLATELSRKVDQETLTTQVLVRVATAVGEAGRRRVVSNHRTLKNLDDNRREISSLRAELVEVRRQANTDPLTGLANRRRFDDVLAEASGRDQAYSLILLDIDHFKRINDADGHAFGDHVLRMVSQAIGRVLRRGTFLARVGGEEFAIVVAKGPAEALVIAERVRQSIEKLRLHNASREIRLTVSLGIAASCHAVMPGDVYELADAALYRSKNAGRNRVTLFDPVQDESSGNRYRIYAG